MATNPIELIRGGRNHSEPVTVLPNFRTSDESDAPLAFNNDNALLF